MVYQSHPCLSSPILIHIETDKSRNPLRTPQMLAEARRRRFGQTKFVEPVAFTRQTVPRCSKPARNVGPKPSTPEDIQCSCASLCPERSCLGSVVGGFGKQLLESQVPDPDGPSLRALRLLKLCNRPYPKQVPKMHDSFGNSVLRRSGEQLCTSWAMQRQRASASSVASRAYKVLTIGA